MLAVMATVMVNAHECHYEHSRRGLLTTVPPQFVELCAPTRRTAELRIEEYRAVNGPYAPVGPIHCRVVEGPMCTLTAGSTVGTSCVCQWSPPGADGGVAIPPRRHRHETRGTCDPHREQALKSCPVSSGAKCDKQGCKPAKRLQRKVSDHLCVSRKLATLLTQESDQARFKYPFQAGACKSECGEPKLYSVHCQGGFTVNARGYPQCGHRRSLPFIAADLTGEMWRDLFRC
jgi:hypothetical protein